MFKAIDLIIGLRVKPAVEEEGLDMDEMGVPGYVGVVDSMGLPDLARSSQGGRSTVASTH
jgi:hypothetical protein